MSKRKLQKYIDRPLNFSGSLTKHAILLSDSKGFSLKSHVDLLDKFNHHIDINLSIWCSISNIPELVA